MWGDSGSKVGDKEQRRILTNCRLSDQELAGDKRKSVGKPIENGTVGQIRLRQKLTSSLNLRDSVI